MANLPSDHVSIEPSFSVVGVDFAGPLYIHLDEYEPNGEPAKSVSKAYICLFTCANSRMIHIELCRNVSTS